MILQASVDDLATDQHAEVKDAVWGGRGGVRGRKKRKKIREARGMSISGHSLTRPTVQIPVEIKKGSDPAAKTL